MVMPVMLSMMLMMLLLMLPIMMSMLLPMLMPLLLVPMLPMVILLLLLLLSMQHHYMVSCKCIQCSRQHKLLLRDHCPPLLRIPNHVAILGDDPLIDLAWSNCEDSCY